MSKGAIGNPAKGTNPVPASRERILVLIFLVMVLFFGLTRLVVSSYRARQGALAQQWSGQGDTAAQAGSFQKAVQDYRTALIYSSGNKSYEMKLAEALLGASQFGEARAYLQSLLDQEPGNGLVNLELARLAVRDHDYPAAVTYFHNSIYGAWETDPQENRRKARLELIQLLLDQGQTNEAQAESITLAASLPSDADLHTQVGTLFLRADADDRALQQFEQALQIKGNLEPALAGAGEAAYRMQDYAQARRYLQSALQENPADSSAAAMLDQATRVVELDPTATHLPTAEKTSRILRAFGLAWTRLDSCLAGRPAYSPGSGVMGDLHSRAQELQPRMLTRTLRRDPDLATQTMDLVDQIEETTAQFCAQPTGDDAALLLIARREKNPQ